LRGIRAAPIALPGHSRLICKPANGPIFATADKGGDIISLIAYVERISQVEAARRLAGMIGVRLGGSND
jgi:hypothetical protein